ncbi:MAG: 5-histidylcysteine sulfoxide synthase/putative 4-mercaptohistidine N1-methyltransferase [Candidatus Azotimanducaceae bacterium]|jgi:5-histidylcysteine sulfoxide synthase/putative 4-mercaptohistidine N1-methyltranferase
MAGSNYLRTPELDTGEIEAKRQEIADYFNVTWERYESLFETLASDSAFFEKPISLRHPLIFYYGHTATFFVNKLILGGLVKKRIDPHFESLFAIGVDEMSWDDLNEENYDWPSVEEVRTYRQKVKAMINQVISDTPLVLPIDWQNAWWPIIMGIEHEQIHLETSSVLIRQQKLDFVKPNKAWQASKETGEAPQNELVNIPSGDVKLGKNFEDPIYGWDNEYGEHEAEVEAFQASKYLVSNREYLSFVDVGGYREDSYWTKEGLEWRNFAQASCPTFWQRSVKGWRLRLMTELIDMPWDWPAEVNFHESKAFCNWYALHTGQSVRLPTEDEWHRLYDFAEIEEIKLGEKSKANIHLDYAASPCPVNTHDHGELYDVIGNVWQWTETPIYPFNGFKVHPYYDDFTMPTFDGKHNLFKGGSWISSGNESRSSSRYAFRRHFFQHVGFRYVVAGEAIMPEVSNYESDKMLSEYAEMHFGDTYYDVPNFPKNLADIAIDAMGDKPMGRALDIGCAVGRASFELAKKFDHVTGIDFSARLINLGVQLADHGFIRYSIADQGDLRLYKERKLSDMALDKLTGTLELIQGDACNLKPSLTGYDLVIAANLIDRLYDPSLFLKSIEERINPGGILMITSPYTWLEEHTDKENWIGGYKKDGENFTTLDGLKAKLEPQFTLMSEPQQVPFVIRETSRKFQHSLSDVSLWVKN